jgi:hypothetical protein
MNKLYDALQVALDALAAGESLEAVLARTPDLDQELRPLLRAALAARAAGLTEIRQDVQRRGRARILQRGAVIRESRVHRSRRIIPAVPRVAITVGLVAMLALSSTGLVSASTGALPGDQLYGVKRSWEDVQLMLVFQSQQYRLLQSHFQQERLDEIDELLAKGQAAPINFSGMVMRSQDGSWLVSGIPVSITGLTTLPSGTIAEGSPVLVSGTTRRDGVVEASRLELLGAGVPLPPLEPSGLEDVHPESDQQDSGPSATPQPGQAGSSQSSEQRHSFEFSGVVETMGQQVWRINGQAVSVDQAAVYGTVKVGSDVKFQGYYVASGRFVVTKIESTDIPTPKVDTREKVPSDKPGDQVPGDSKPGGTSPGDGGEGGGSGD